MGVSRTRDLGVLALAAFCAVLAAPSGARADDVPFEAALEGAWTDLEQLEDLLDDAKASNREIQTYLTLVLDTAAELSLPPIDDAEGEAAGVAAQRRSWTRSLEKLQDESVDLLLEALMETDLNRSGANDRAPVNRHAAALLVRPASFVEGAKERKRLSRRIMRKVKRLEKARHPVHADIFEGVFLALARLQDPGSLEWLMENYLHARKRPEEVARLKAALRAMRAFEPMPGELRHRLVDEMLKRYLAMETLAETSTTDVSALAAQRFWNTIREDAIPLIQYAAGYPQGPSGAALASMHEFSIWFRDHDNPRKAPWTTKVQAAER